MTVYTITGDGVFEPAQTTGMVDTAKFDTRDKYGAFWAATTAIR